jgi:hypothetical protein
MKVSDFLRQYQLSGELPDDGGDEMLNFYAVWLITASYKVTITTIDQARKDAITIAEFIEKRARD